MAAGRGVARRLGLAGSMLRGRRLTDFVAEPPEEVARLLAASARARDPVLGSLTVDAPAGPLPCRAEGAVFQPRTGEEEAIVLLCLVPKEAASSRFVALTQQIDSQSREIARRARAETELREQREWLRVTLASIGDAVIATDAEGKVAFLNAVATVMTGWPPHEAEGRSMTEVFRIVNEFTREPAENPVGRVLSEGVTVGLANHTLLIHRDGTERPIEDSAAPIRNENGAVAGVVLVFRDATERRLAETMLREEARAAEALHRVGELVAQERDLARVVQLATDEAVRLTGAAFGAFFYNQADATGESYMLFTLSGISQEVFASFPMPRITALFRTTFRGEGPVRLADVALDPRFGNNPPHRGIPAGHPPVRSFLAVPVVARSGEVLGGLFFGHPDAAVFSARGERLAVGIAASTAVAIENARLHAQLESRVAELAETDRRKDEFLALLGHELRNPLAPIRNAVQLLTLRPGDPVIVTQARDMIGRQAAHMTRLVDELLDASRIARGMVTLKQVRLDLAALVGGVAADHRASLEAVGLRLTLEIQAAPLWVDGDATRLAQVLGNLLHNASKFTDAGGRVTVRLSEEAGQARLSVEDTGIGIDPSALPRLFDEFAQVDATIERSKGGLGLGLAVVRGLAELHGGTATVASAGLGTGSIFTVRLPLHRQTAPDEASPAPGVAPASVPTLRKVLVVEDGADAAESLRLLLGLHGFEVEVARDGLGGLAAARRRAFHAVVCDLGLPGMSGFEVARALRAEPATADLLLVCLSGYGQEEDRRKAIEAGFDAHFAKADDLEPLLRLLGMGRSASP